MGASADGQSINLNFIGGEFTPATGSKTFEKLDPSTGVVNAQVADSDLMDVVKAIQAANKSLVTWIKATSIERAAVLEAVASAIEANADAFSIAAARDLGTPVTLTRRYSVPDSAAIFRAHASDLRSESTPTPHPMPPSGASFRTPIGIVGLITPASDPLGSLSSRVAAALACGNAVIAKVSRSTPETGVEFARAIQQAGVPAGVVSILQGRRESVGETLVQHPAISTLSFMGSTESGRRVNAMAAESLKRVHFSLGAKNAVVLFAGVDLKAVIPQVAAVCLGLFPSRALQGSRLFIQESIFKESLELLKSAFAAARIGNPLDPETQIGPLPTAAAAAGFRAASAFAKKENGKMVTGQDLLESKGNFVQPVLFADLTNCSTLQQDEIVGPLVLASSFKYQHEALKHANVSPFGRVGYIFESDPEKATKVIARFEAGTIFLNTGEPKLAAAVRIPLLKNSGHLDEGRLGLTEFFSRSHRLS